MESITIPFVGAEAGKTANDTYQYPFGYIFGTSSYTGSTAVTQYYYGSSTSSITSTTYYTPSSLRKVTVTGGNILYGAFYKCCSLTSVTIGNDVTSIGSSAFYGCSSLNYNIKDNLKYLGNSELPYLYLADTINSDITTSQIDLNCKFIGDSAFENCSRLTGITIPNNVKNIGRYAFYGCSELTSITIPNSVTSFGDYAFKNCTRLKSITYKGTKTQWGKIIKGYQWNSGLGYNAGYCTVKCTDGNLETNYE